MIRRTALTGLLIFFGLCVTSALLNADRARASTTITVNTVADVIGDDGSCSLREAIRAANLDVASGALPSECPAGSGADMIILPAGIYTLTIPGTGEIAAATGDLNIMSGVTLNGVGAASTIIDGGGIDRVFHITGTASVVISSITVRNGRLTNDLGGGIVVLSNSVVTVTNSIVSNNTGVSVGGIFNNRGTLMLLNSMVNSNSGAGVANYYGSLTVNSSTVSGNLTGTSAVGVSNAYGTASLLNSTVSGNSGAGVENLDGIMTVANSTISGNGNKGIAAPSGTVTFTTSILAGNSGSDCSGTLISQGYNLIQDTTSCTITGTLTGNITGMNPDLGPLQANGGPTLTHALLPGSPAIDAGNPAGCMDGLGNPLLADQRGFVRPGDGDGNGSAICDIGAYELWIPTSWIFLPSILR